MPRATVPLTSMPPLPPSQVWLLPTFRPRLRVCNWLLALVMLPVVVSVLPMNTNGPAPCRKLMPDTEVRATMSCRARKPKLPSKTRLSPFFGKVKMLLACARSQLFQSPSPADQLQASEPLPGAALHIAPVQVRVAAPTGAAAPSAAATARASVRRLGALGMRVARRVGRARAAARKVARGKRCRLVGMGILSSAKSDRLTIVEGPGNVLYAELNVALTPGLRGMPGGTPPN